MAQYGKGVSYRILLKNPLVEICGSALGVIKPSINWRSLNVINYEGLTF